MFLSKTRSKLNIYSLQKRFFEQDFQFVRQNNKAYLDISIDKQPIGRLTFELYTKYTPRTALNFYNFCKGFQNKEGKLFSYKNTKFHKVIPGMLIQGGQVSDNNSVSYYGKQFADENFVISHESVGILSMANNAINTNGSQFFITTSDCSWFDGKHVAFGKVIEGIEDKSLVNNYYSKIKFRTIASFLKKKERF